jgi:hypothetical protein
MSPSQKWVDINKVVARSASLSSAHLKVESTSFLRHYHMLVDATETRKKYQRILVLFFSFVADPLCTVIVIVTFSDTTKTYR